MRLKALLMVVNLPSNLLRNRNSNPSVSVFNCLSTSNALSFKGTERRASLPSPEKVFVSVQKLAERTGLNEKGILSVTSSVSNRGQLSGITSDEFARKWSEQLNLPVREVEDFLVETGYMIRTD
jgi:hypothetical protein